MRIKCIKGIVTKQRAVPITYPLTKATKIKLHILQIPLVAKLFTPRSMPFEASDQSIHDW
jgi:hypothetical protein